MLLLFIQLATLNDMYGRDICAINMSQWVCVYVTQNMRSHCHAVSLLRTSSLTAQMNLMEVNLTTMQL
jgi:hypothetical protein